jgi:hypothetical protein
VLDVAPRHGLRGAAGLHRAGELDGVAGGRVEDVERGLYGIQFHPEVVHTPYGQQILTTFLRDLRLRATWSAASIIEEQIARSAPRSATGA